MDDLLSEKEQIEQIRSWWSTYGGYVILGVAAGALLLFGFTFVINTLAELVRVRLRRKFGRL